MNKLLVGALAGFAATVPMTIVMLSLHRALPPQERDPLPPEDITQNAAQATNAEELVDEPEKHLAATLTNHFGFGALAGALYAPTASRIAAPDLAKGVVWGLLVWAASYLGWLPATGLYPSATEQPPHRNALMIASHIVWGAALGLLTRRDDA